MFFLVAEKVIKREKKVHFILWLYDTSGSIKPNQVDPYE